MLSLVYSNQTERLLEALVEDLGEHRQRLGALEPAHLVIPNRNIETFLRFGIAARIGIAANLEVHLLRRFLAELLAGGREPLEILDADALRALVLEQLLDDDTLKKKELAPVRAYLHAAGDAADAIDLRRVQLADKLGRLFEEYGFSREQMLQQWPRGPALAGTQLAQTEGWQRALWLRIFGPEGSVARRSEVDGVRRVQLGALLDTLEPRKLALPARIHVFGVSYVARAFQRIFAMLAARCELHVYALNPCREFWEDVRTERESRKLDEAYPFHLTEGENAPLRLWGRPGRENIRLLNTLAQCDFREAFAEANDRSSLLRHLQQDILERAPQPATPAGLEPDESVRLLACPSIRREAEAVAEEIWALVEREPTLRFNEIAVIVAGREPDAYFSHLSAAFRACHELPHNVVDLGFSSTSRVAEAVGLLLALPLGGFTRPELLAVLTHPAARARFPDVEPERWVQWCDRLEILHGADHADHAGTYIDHDVYSWDQGLRRLALGAFMTGERSGDERAVAVGGEQYLPEEHARSDQAAAAQLSMSVRSLIADARFARKAELRLSEWSTFLAALVEAHLGAASPREQRELDHALSVLRALAEVELGDREVSYRVAYELATRALADLPGGRGQHLADGVVVSTSQPMRAIPFKVVFMVGMGEGQFPAADRRDPLDLRAAKPQAGDVSPRERDRYLFLETLLCARERLYLSYVARNPVSGEALSPSAVVSELLQVLESSYLGAGGRARLVRHYKLRRHQSPDELREDRITFPEARRERIAAKLRLSLGERPLPTLEELRATLPGETFERLATQLGLAPMHRATDAELQRPRLSISALKRFLECPLQGYARFGLRLEDHDDDLEDAQERADERFATASRDAAVRLRHAFVRAVSSGKFDLEAQYRAMIDRLVRSGRAPVGLFGAVEQQRHLAILESWAELLRAAPEARAAIREHRFGGAQEHEQVDAPHDPLRLRLELRPRGAEPRQVELELVGRVSTLAEAPWSSLALLTSRPPEKWAHQAHERGINAYVDQLVLSAAGIHSGVHRALALYGGDEPLAGALELAPIAPDAARAQLARLASDLLSGGHAYLLPCQAVFKSRLAKDGPSSLAREVDELRDNDKARMSSRYGPIREYADYPALPDALANAIVDARFGSFLSRVKVIE